MKFYFGLKSLKLSNQIFIILLLNYIILGSFLTSYCITIVIDNNNKPERELAAATSQAVMEKIDRNFYERYSDVQAFAVNNLAISAVKGSAKKIDIEEFMNTMTSIYVLYDLMMVCNADGNIIAVNTKDKNGKPIQSAFLIGKDISNSQWFINCKSLKAKAYYSDFTINKDVARITHGNGRGMAFAAPIKNKIGKTIGAWYNFSSWDQIVVNIRRESEKVLQNKDSNSHILITDSQGIVIDAEDKSLLSEFPLQKDPFNNTNRKFKGKCLNAANWNIGWGIAKGAYTYEGRNWKALTVIPAMVFSIKTLLTSPLINILLFALLIVFTGILSASSYASDISKRIKNIKYVITQLADGKLIVTDITGRDEIAEMASSVNRLSDSLQIKTWFAKEIGNGNLETEYTAISPEDLLGNALLEMQNSLIWAEKDLRESIKRFQSLVQNSSDITTLLKLDGKIIYESPSFYKLFGYKDIEVLGKSAFDFVHPDDIALVIETFENLLNNPGAESIIELRFRKKSGAWITLETIANNLLDDEAINGIIVNSRDITERKKSDAEVKDKSQMLKGIISNMPVIVFRIDPDGIFTDSIGAGLSILNLQENQVKGLSVFDIIPESAENIRKALNGSYVSYTSNGRSEGKEWYFETFVFPDEIYKGNIIGFSLDVTERKIAERKLLEYTVNLEKSNKELDKFNYVVAHDLKAPLRAIYSLSEWIEDELGSQVKESVRGNFKLLKERTIRLDNFLNGLLEYSKISKAFIEYEELNIEGAIKSILAELEVPKGFEVIHKTSIPTIVANRYRFTKILSVIINNAIKHNDKENGIAWLTIEAIDSFYQISIKDNGPGIDPEYHDRIFVMFQTLKARDEFESTGLGLAIVKKIVDEENGKIEINSKEGSGTEFIVSLPKIKLAATESLFFF